MGEYAEMMLDGTMCQVCGEYLGGDDGYPVTCESCRRADRYEPRVPKADRYKMKGNQKLAKPGDAIRQGDRMACPFCVKSVKVTGFGDHMLDQHRDKWKATPASHERNEG